MKKPLRIKILERLEQFRPGQFPIEFHLVRPLPDIKADAGEILHEIYRLSEAGLIDARMLPRTQGKLTGGSILGTTLQGKKELEEWNEKRRSASILRKVPIAIWAILIFIVGGIATELLKPVGDYLAGYLMLHFHLP